MKQLLVWMVFMVLGLSATAQVLVEGEEQEEPEQFIYCELVGIQRAFSNKVTVQIDYGQENRLFSNDQRIIDRRTGKPKVFNSMIDAMNTMGEIGWQFVQAYVLFSGGNQNEIHYILKRPMNEEERKRVVPVTRGDVKRN